MTVNYAEVRRVISNLSNKGIKSVSHHDIVNNKSPFLEKYSNFLDDLSAYDVASIIHDMGHWEKFKYPSTKPYKYNRRDIVFVNLGSNNIGYEASYRHPCIIYQNGYNDALVIPCSTGRYHVKNEYILKGERTDGFNEKTGIQLDKLRVIDKHRIEGKVLGRVSNKKFNEITNQIIELYFSPVKKKIDKLELEKSQLMLEIGILKAEKEKLIADKS
ncbi:type II toxin-antitoxin system PemK/MazF family toxin [Bacillus sp. UMB0728]|uniref:type II toxin-antitoxin system PemK/MazF family toxin n=1 Tax=Bacillus sp. UMB0728 TaxID=2066052 RepID=UPI0015E02341|nr:type II toxin-antitoxin system PemK/MazF family toxin [Bacillus sp. UMB0728]